MFAVIGFPEVGVFFDDARKAWQQFGPQGVDQLRRVLPTALVALAAADRPAMRYRLLDRATQGMQVVRQVGRVQGRAGSDHAAADVHADGRRNDRAACRDHAADRRALAQMHVRHHREVAEDERQAGGVDQLQSGLVLHRHAFGPHLDRSSIRHLDDFDCVGVHASEPSPTEVASA